MKDCPYDPVSGTVSLVRKRLCEPVCGVLCLRVQVNNSRPDRYANAIGVIPYSINIPDTFLTTGG